MTEFDGAKLLLFLGPRLIVLRRDARPDIPWPDGLDLPGGGRDGDESPEACVLRETREELGLAFAADQLIPAGQRMNPAGTGVYFALHGDPSLAQQIRFGSEGQGWTAMPPGRFIRHPRAIPHLAQVVEAYVSGRRRGISRA